MEGEQKSVDDSGTWKLTTSPEEHKPIGLKWVSNVKRDPDGNVVKYKARPVAK